MTHRKFVVLAVVAAAVLGSSVDGAAARSLRRHHGRAVERLRTDSTTPGFTAGAVLGLLGVGIAGAATASNGYSDSFPPYGSGAGGYGYYGPGYGYYGY